MKIQTDQIQIGDYAYITFKNGKISKTYSYYIIKIESDKGITLQQFNDMRKELLLINVNQNKNTIGIWQIIECLDLHTVIFTRNTAQTEYFERDLTSGLEKILIIKEAVDDSNILPNNFAELNNGIILYQWGDLGLFQFADPNNINETDKITTFIGKLIFRGNSPYELLNFDGEIYVYSHQQKIIAKLNLNDFSYSVIESNSDLSYVYPLKNKKILCFLQDQTMYIFDLIKKNRIAIDCNIFDFRTANHHLKQLTNGDIIFKAVDHDTSSNFRTFFYRADINNGTLNKIGKFNNWVEIIAVLPADEILFMSHDIITGGLIIQLWNLNSNDIITIGFSARYMVVHVESEILQNGDVLFCIDKIFYLFDHITQKMAILPLFNNKYSQATEVNSFVIFKELKNGNLIMLNEKYLSIIEFPINWKVINCKNYDKIVNNILTLIPDLKNLIRNYL